ncbi:hypothetical protein PO909_001853 [Leuciscus waleckii]
MKPWSERISSLSSCRQLFVQEDAVPPVPYPKQARPGPMSNKKSSASSPLSGIPPAVCHGKLPLLGARHIQRNMSFSHCADGSHRLLNLMPAVPCHKKKVSHMGLEQHEEL